MATIIPEPSRSLKEYRLLTGKTTTDSVMSRVGISTRLCRHADSYLYLELPLLSAAMQAVTGREMAVALGKLGGLGVLPASLEPKKQAALVGDVKKEGILAAAAVSTQPADRERIDMLLHAGAGVLFIDASDGYSEFQAETLSYIRSKSRVPVVGGNIIHAEAFKFLAEAGFDAVKVGMGIGSGCTTQAQKGTGRGQATALIDVCRARDELYSRTGRYIPVISDGSVSNSGQIMVALVLGADSVMMGRFFAGFTESAGKAVKHPVLGQAKEYWMEASSRARSLGRYNATAATFFEEGVEGFVRHEGKLEVCLPRTILKIKSAMSSCGCASIDELHKKAVVELQSEAALRDADVHSLEEKKTGPARYQ